MKKLLYSAVALATLLFAACQQEKLETAEGADVVTFTVEAPGAIASKALAAGQVIADGTNVNEVHYAVYKPGNAGAYSLENPDTTPLAQGIVPMSEKHATITFDLLKNQDYVVIFWAQVKDAGHYTLGDLRNITVNTSVNSEGVHEVNGNDETRAAFYKKYEFNTNVKSHRVELVRPFAQLNLLTTQESLLLDQPGQTTAVNRIEVLTSEVVVTGLSTTFNTVDGLSPAGTETIKYTMIETPAQQGQEFLEVNDVNYHYVSMNYFFVPEDSALVDVTYTLTADPGDENIQNTIINVPVKENFRTNIIGNLLTTSTDFEIVVDQRFNEPALPDNEADELNIAAQIGGTFVLNSDIELTSPLVVNENSQLVLDLNGHTITGTVGRDAENARVHVIVNNGNLVISNGTVTSAGVNGGSAIMNSGVLKVNNVTLNGAPNAGNAWPSYAINNNGTAELTNSYITSYHGAVATYGAEAVTTLNDTDVEMAGIEGFTSHGLYVYDAGKTYVNGGSIANRAADQASTGGSVINGEVYVSAGEFTGRIEAYYGRPVLKGGVYSVKPTSYVPSEGYLVKENSNGTWAVLPDVDGAEEMVYHQASGLFYNGNDAGWKGVYYVMNASDLKKAAAYFAGQSHSNEGNGITIELLSDIDLAGSTWEPWNVMWLTLNGNGNTISNITCAEGSKSGFFAYIGASKVNDLTLKNVVAAGAQAGLFAASVEGVTVNGLKIAGKNSVSYIEDPSEAYGGIGAVTGILVDAAVNGEIVEGATVSVDYNDIVTLAERQSALTGYLQANKGVFSLKGNLQSGAAVYQFSDNGTKVSLKPAEDNATTMRAIVEYSNIESAVVEEGIQVLGNRTFRACSNLAEVELPSTLTTIEEGAFQKAGLVSIEIPENVTYIGTTALGACSALETVIIKAKDITIANYCARGCANLRSVYIYSDNVVFEQDGRASMHFTNQESNNASSITYYVKNQNVADALNASVPITHAKGMKIASIDGATIYYTR